MQAKTAEFKSKLAAGQTIDEILPEAFAVVREASKRVMNMRHFDVQMIGGLALHQGKIAEMRTGEGKTLTATLPVYLNALTGKGVHVVTVNDYLAERDAEWMAKLYNFLGLTVGINMPQAPREDKQQAYNSDITYGTNNEYGFDYLRDNMVYEAGDRVQRGLNFAIVDEVDSILIDEARTPLIISGQAEDHTELYLAINKAIPRLVKQEGEADPITGEGIALALESGALAGKAAHDAISRGAPSSAYKSYKRSLSNIHRDLRYAKVVRFLMFHWTTREAVHNAFARSSVTDMYLQLLSGGVDYPTIAKRVLRKVPILMVRVLKARSRASIAWPSIQRRSTS